jgi:hypothetical protein
MTPEGSADVLGYVVRNPKQGGAKAAIAVPDDLQRRLAPWVDVPEVGAEGLWVWLGTILPLLPRPADAPGERRSPEPAERVRELARELVDCARERARLHVLCESYYRDNALLARRLKALEAALRTFDVAGRPAPPTPDEEGAGAAAERYLPRRGSPP